MILARDKLPRGFFSILKKKQFFKYKTMQNNGKKSQITLCLFRKF